MTRDTIIKEISSAEFQGNSYTDIEGLEALLGAWTGRNGGRAWEQDGDDDAVLVITYWDDELGRQVIEVTRFDTDAEAAIGYGWSLTGLPFNVDLPAAPRGESRPVTLADLDGTVDAPDWIQTGHVLDASEVSYLRSLLLPEPVAPRTGR